MLMVMVIMIDEDDDELWSCLWICVVLGSGLGFGLGLPTSSELILEWGRRGEARRTESGGPSPQIGGLRERCKLPSGVRAEGFSCILSRQIAFPSISVRVAYSLHG